ncbi:hypothetical protein PTTG_29039 [Puccinia triticina 1-1 BBBD Race 1]|uniref:Uncharacterized protein n=1 Tax=Puccinia triticina (isolate 1-1 / race 1 (BBBD)) TaxID=630390 RepID=A0A180G6Z6_PUCT1|nr:hypothetical protein PTTG_29039 [Puccinia triticina 1-1 BBBD Race 1]
MVEEMVKRANKRLNKAPDNQTAIQVQGLNALDAEDHAVVEGPAIQENLSSRVGISDKNKETTHDSDSEDSFKEIPNSLKDAQEDVAAKYKAILSNVPVIIEPGQVNVTKASGKANNPPTVTNDPPPPMMMGSTLNAPDKPDILRASSSDAVNPALNIAKQSTDKTSIVFIKGSFPKHFDVGFTPYFDRNIREFRGPIPLTIFDKNWQRDAIQWYTNRRSKGDEKDGNYIGYEYPNEWSQSFSKWTTNHRNFYITFRDLYGYPEFAEWILLHKENVDKIVGEEGFMTAFRYNMIVRQNAFSYQVATESGAISAVDISMYCDDVKREAWRITLTLGENNETDNPYAIGGEKYGYNPNTGKPRVKIQKVNEDQWKHDSGSNRGKGGYCGRGSGRWSQERRNSDYGGYNDFQQSEDGYNKRPRDHGYGDYDYHRSNDSGFNHHGGYSRERGGYGRDQGPSRSFKKKDHLSSAKEKES